MLYQLTGMRGSVSGSAIATRKKQDSRGISIIHANGYECMFGRHTSRGMIMTVPGCTLGYSGPRAAPAGHGNKLHGKGCGDDGVTCWHGILQGWWVADSSWPSIPF